MTDDELRKYQDAIAARNDTILALRRMNKVLKYEVEDERARCDAWKEQAKGWEQRFLDLQNQLRYNIEWIDGGVAICKGDHDKSDKCEWEYFYKK